MQQQFNGVTNYYWLNVEKNMHSAFVERIHFYAKTETSCFYGAKCLKDIR